MPGYGLAMCLVPLLSFSLNAQAPTALSPVHRRTRFAFTVNAAYDQVAPLFGADTERLWAEGWNPQFVYPQPAHDQAGAVFTLVGGHSSVWINTIYDLEHGHVQYACFAGEKMATLIDIRIEKLMNTSTKVDVTYERTALQANANEHVNHLADDDKNKGPEWEAAIRAYLHQAH